MESGGRGELLGRDMKHPYSRYAGLYGCQPKNRGGFYPPKWMVKRMENPINMGDLGVPLFLETPIL